MAHRRGFLVQSLLFPRIFGTRRSLRLPSCPAPSEAPVWQSPSQLSPRPNLDVVPGAYGWRAVGGSGRARLEVRVQSLFDGSIDVQRRDVPFLVDDPLVLGPDGAVSVADG